jgi:hypothetical protein
MAPKKKPYKTLDEAAWRAAYKHNIEGPGGKVNPFGYATRLDKAMGNPMQYNDGINPNEIKPHKSTATKSKNRFPSGGYLA